MNVTKRENWKYQIIQQYGWRNSDGTPIISSSHNVIIKQFKTYLGAMWWKFWFYDCIVEAGWKMSFVWKIKKQ